MINQLSQNENQIKRVTTFMGWTRYYQGQAHDCYGCHEILRQFPLRGFKIPRIISLGDSSTSSDTSLRTFLLLSPILVPEVKCMLFLEVLSTENSILSIRKIRVLIFMSELVNQKSSYYLQKLQTFVSMSVGLRSQKFGQSMVPAPDKVSDTGVSNSIDLFFINKT